MGKKSNPAQDVVQQAKEQIPATTTPSANENTMGGLAGDVGGVYRNAVAGDQKNYGDIMGGYNTFKNNITGSPLGQANQAFGEFAKTGGFSPQDIQDMRARGVSPIRAAYGNTMQNLDRARALGGGGANAPNYIAAVSRAQRELPQQLSDATQGVNANLAQQIQQGKLAGMGGMASTGQAMGAEELGALSGQNSLYGTTPGQSNAFANQMLGFNQARLGEQGQRQGYGLGLMDTRLRGYGANQDAQGSPWWQTALGVAGTVAPFFSDRTMKKDIKRIPDGSMRDKLIKLPLYTWKYKGEKTQHIGPMAQAFKKTFNVGDGKTIHPADVMGVILASAKEAVNA
jgi:hypothetical protein